MNKEFDLSKCIKKDFFDKDLYRLAPFIDVIDIEEFIKKIKFEMVKEWKKGEFKFPVGEYTAIIDKLAGKELRKK